MAEFPSLGSHCEEESCGQLDFLPFVCNGCNRTYCKDHRAKTSHSCTSNDQEDQGNMAKCGALSSEYQECAIEDCRSCDLVPVLCEHCHNNYCVRHRHQTDHKCSALPDKQARIKPEDRIKEIIGKELNKEKKGPGGMRNERRAAKVALMKIKMKAIGDPSVPQDERVYLRVLMPLGNKEREQPMFFSKYWTIGKIIDKIAVAAKLKNENNVNVTEKMVP
ncbi:AN1-type zinc finger protein 1-like isoform X3 [Porites lutea]|uniref:AN1-type zinc finger protein 1-like isoform X3 n=1 Tax=Porites lutea TaxID=51062 RepID=UPI003CC55374